MSRARRAEQYRLTQTHLYMEKWRMRTIVWRRAYAITRCAYLCTTIEYDPMGTGEALCSITRIGDIRAFPNDGPHCPECLKVIRNLLGPIPLQMLLDA